MGGMTSFSTDDIPALTGRRAIVTGANSGTGYETARSLAAKGADVIVAARSHDRAMAAIADIEAKHPDARLRFEQLDLSRQASVTAFAERLLAEGRPIDILVNNAGVMALPARQETEDGFEMQLATNYLGHFALTAQLLPLLSAGAARVVQVSSIAHRQGRIRLDDLNYTDGYRAWPVYAQSKLAMLMFGLELDRRSRAHDWGLTSVAAHPGVARTALIANGPLNGSRIGRSLHRWLVRPLIEPLVTHSQAAGALPILMAATAPDTQPGTYLGPTGLREIKGPPGTAVPSEQALDADLAARLWSASERLTGVSWGPH